MIEYADSLSKKNLHGRKFKYLKLFLAKIVCYEVLFSHNV